MTSATFRPHEHLRDPAAFRRAFNRRKTASDATLIVYAVENGLDHARLGLSIGKKKIRKAVGRNRAKRLIREAFRLNKAALPPGVDYVVVPRGPALTSAQTRTAFPRLARDAARRLGPRAGQASP